MSSETHARCLRRASQLAGISGPESWDDISERRRTQWMTLAEELPKTGALLFDPEAVAALRRILRRWFDPDDCDEDPAVDEAYDRLRTILGGWRCGYCGSIGNDPSVTECSVCGTHQRDVDAALEGPR